MPHIIDGVTFYSEDEARERAYTKIKKDASKIALRYRKSETVSV